MLEQMGNSAITSLGFFWKAGWAFVVGYFISSMIQAFVPKDKMVKYMGNAKLKSVGLSTLFGAISSSCSFAALAAGKSLFKKGAHFVPTLAFLFASTNLVVELGILIYIFLGWQFVVAEIIGGIALIFVTWLLVKLTYPKKLVEEARENVEDNEMEDNFDWKKKIKTKEGWLQVGHEFVMNWQMVWKEITIGFTLAGIMATFVSANTWKAFFLVDQADGFFKVLENAAVGPLVAMLTFIGSLGNIPIATILASSGVAFAGIMAFIYSDLIVPPIVAVHKKYYGMKTALYIAAVFYVSILITALGINYAFTSVGFLPESAKQIMEESPFQINYTFWLNIVFAFLAWFALYLNKKFKQSTSHSMMMMNMEGDSKFKTIVTYACLGYLAVGLLISLM
ncbi:permease [Aquibacillus sp. 3ASR75-11]|uniref:Permease n=1 Tax=Terrihalobacillus insolitus TaxID=2950438 RepID=A0A9X3WU21_9BACI|nr:permease [Terrihalobacillus insolitus]MDC3412580.1 permease [Terrihalobacillus insolitus]MDC3423931.1 permease [Terrihalobacillus insolitus]